MRFSRLRLNGFKSFVDPTDLVIHDGLTGVVGPNGCGKSNLLEALRWVMGENRPTAMRGDGMEDVIFAGAATRGARNFAEVTLTIDNSERLAPSGFNEADQIDIVRRITRDAGSAYKANGKDVRARDVQMLFADASTGSHSPALVRQGQIAELINARPKNRRRILEEAAGISGLYQRRNEAEQKLAAAEQNLSRVDDLVESLAQQLQSLARQARQAARYREIGTELRRAEGMLLWRRWREAEQAHADAEAALGLRVREAAQAESAALAAARARSEVETALPALREEEAVAGAIVQRLRLQRDALDEEEARAAQGIAALEQRIVQMAADRAREEALNRDAGETIARLEWELEQIAAATDGHENRLQSAVEAAGEAASVLADREALLSERTEDAARLAARHQSVERLRTEAQSNLARAEEASLRAETQASEAETSLARAGDEAAQAGQAMTVAQAESAASETALEQADERRNEAQSRESEARAARSAAEGEAGALRAELAALAKLVDREAQAGKQVLDRLRVSSGHEAALGAALADDLRAPEVQGATGSGWVALPPYGSTQPLPEKCEPLSRHVEAPPALARRLSQIGVVARTDGPRLQPLLGPGQRLVSLEGDLWRWDGLRTTAEDAPSAAALRMRQLNRLVELKRDLEEAAARADGARIAHEHLSQALAEAGSADQTAREARRDADRRLAEASRAQSRAEAEQSIAGGKLETARLARGRYEDEAREARARLREAEEAIGALPALDAVRAAVDEVKIAVEAARVTMLTRRSAHDEVRREGESRTRRRQEILRELSGWRKRLETATERMADLDHRQGAAQDDLTEARLVPATLAERHEHLVEAITRDEARKAEASDRLSTAETALRRAAEAEREAERIAGEAREARARSEARTDGTRDAAAQAAGRIEEEAGLSPEELLEEIGALPETVPGAETLDTEVTRLRRQREALGAVNLRAEEDAREVQDEHDTLVQEKGDLEEAIRKLRGGIAGLNREGRERLLTAFEQVNTSFRALFTHLFGGGEANLVLVESDDPLEAGLEIMCQPPGKKLATLSLLSGGEQTLTAMALIFAVFLANPAPICVLDEVDAPLDDANVTRLCDLWTR